MSSSVAPVLGFSALFVPSAKQFVQRCRIRVSTTRHGYGVRPRSNSQPRCGKSARASYSRFAFFRRRSDDEKASANRAGSRRDASELRRDLLLENLVLRQKSA